MLSLIFKKQQLAFILLLNSIYKDKQNDYILFHTNNDKSIEISILEMLSEYNEQDRYYNNILNHLIMVFLQNYLETMKIV